jgi:rhodanese-related sulfurtransferase
MPLVRTLSWNAVLRLLRMRFPDVRSLPAEVLAAWLASEREPPVLLDVRTAEEYAVSHLAGALRVDPETEPAALPAALARTAPVVAYCSVGYRSSALAARLQEAGFTAVYNLEGSLFAWANAGRPVYRGGTRVREVHPYNTLWGTLLLAGLHAYAPGDAGSGR